jgi:hypothetical protein
VPNLLYVSKKWLRERYSRLDMLTDEQVLLWACPRCHSMPGDPCGAGGQVREGYHPLRLFLALDQNAYEQAKYEEEQHDASRR